jgi:hypothetical protein
MAGSSASWLLLQSGNGGDLGTLRYTIVRRRRLFFEVLYCILIASLVLALEDMAGGGQAYAQLLEREAQGSNTSFRRWMRFGLVDGLSALWEARFMSSGAWTRLAMPTQVQLDSVAARR